MNDDEWYYCYIISMYWCMCMRANITCICMSVKLCVSYGTRGYPAFLNPQKRWVPLSFSVASGPTGLTYKIIMNQQQNVVSQQALGWVSGTGMIAGTRWYQGYHLHILHMLWHEKNHDSDEGESPGPPHTIAFSAGSSSTFSAFSFCAFRNFSCNFFCAAWDSSSL